ncbi:MAG TPA: pyridoxal phosphate-dependent aminotransferase [Ktedonobacterales bacterium]|jgi:aspartate/methionine/tyrosine aminotransferase|nr:pyridoxal phosphate-dependent aminotransferase [Ktedonobacterales bacterium]
MPDAIQQSDLSARALDDSPQVSGAPDDSSDNADFRAAIARMRDAACERARPEVKDGAAPIRVMARMVNELVAECRAEGIPEAIIAAEVVNRTIGDIDVRRISATEDGPQFLSIADDMGLALPGEVISGYVAKGRTYRWIQRRMQEIERELLAEHVDLRIYDLSSVGAMRLREALAAHAQRAWGVGFAPQQIYANLGSTDGLSKFWQGLVAWRRQQGERAFAGIFPTPGFNVPEWQANNIGIRSENIHTRAEDQFKVTPATLSQALDAAPDARIIYLTISNNPTAFAYTPDELRALYRMLDERGSDLTVVADLAYIGTGDPAADRARVRALAEPNARARTVYVFTFSKSHTLTGDRFGWVAFGAPELAKAVAVGWSNTAASLPADWQLRYMALLELFARRPRVETRIRALYRLRRARLVRQLAVINAERPIFARINVDDDSTVYNWSQLAPGEDVFSLFSKTGIAGVPGGAFGYTDDYVRLSVGCIPVPEV